MDHKHSILMIDEGDDFCEELSLLLAESGFSITLAPDTSRARTLLGEQDFDLVILGTPSYYLDETPDRAADTIDQLCVVDGNAPPLVILAYEPNFARDDRTLPGVTTISLYDFEINRFLASVRRAIGEG